ncbi:MAG TPA: molybdenum cofactor biosynthesis protein MoaE [Rhodothermales bacterium]
MTEKSIYVSIEKGPLNAASIDAFLRDERAGAVCIFTGTTRRWTGSDETTRLDYEAYDDMAESVMRDLAEKALSRWSLTRAALVHRTGPVPLTEASVIVGVSAPHRDDAFDACRWLIDTLKTEVPIWKKERYADGRSEWVGPS